MKISKIQKILIFTCLFVVPMNAFFARRCAYSTNFSNRRSYSMHYGKSRGYVQKAPYAGFGQVSRVNGLRKTKIVSGYFKPSSGYKYVNPYARSK
ncbi:hypothetical protein KAW80_02600 [Candidatus Babeliales bacterium]|nr:hypothetical protein [Candidatus Babeliales bacterium]